LPFIPIKKSRQIRHQRHYYPSVEFIVSSVLINFRSRCEPTARSAGNIGAKMEQTPGESIGLMEPPSAGDAGQLSTSGTNRWCTSKLKNTIIASVETVTRKDSSMIENAAR